MISKLVFFDRDEILQMHADSLMNRDFKYDVSTLQAVPFLEKNENVVFLGPSGVGKTHLATAIGVAAAKKRVSTYFIKCHDLLQQLKKAKSSILVAVFGIVISSTI